MSTDSEKKSRLSGVFPPTVTAFNNDGSLSTKGTREFVRFLVQEGVDGLTPLGSAGEPVALSHTERMQALEAIVDEVSGRIPIYAGTSDYSTASTIELSLHGRSIGCGSVPTAAAEARRPESFPAYSGAGWVAHHDLQRSRLDRY
jgi:dihydrodipicolinate synthase/N-acetylneuraminate lyase